MPSKLKIFLVVLLAIIFPRIIRLCLIMRFGGMVHFNQPGPCRLVKNIANGAEDIQLIGDGKMFVSSGLRFQKDITKPPWKDVKGHIYLFDINTEELTLLTVEGDIDMETFNPHGISVWKDKDSVTLFVVNHRPDLEVIERFTYDAFRPTVLKHEETISSEYIDFPNDLVAVGPRQFYFTNFQAWHHYGKLLAKAEVYLLLHLGSVGFYDGQNSRIVESGLFIPNGINKSPDGRHIYVVNIEEVKVFERQSDDDLIIKQNFYMPGIGDNIDIDPDTGDIWLGFHGIPHLVVAHLEEESKKAPSQVLHLPVSNGLITHSNNVYSEDGSRYVSGASVAAKYKNKLMIGTVNNRAVVCDIMYHQI